MKKKLENLFVLEKKGMYCQALEELREVLNIGGLDAVEALKVKLLEQRLSLRLNKSKSQAKIIKEKSNITQDTSKIDKQSTWSAVITMWKRQDYLAEQLAAIRAQSIPPQEIIIILNEGHLSDSKIREISGADVKIIRSDINSLYTRWSIAYIAEGEYVSVFDDDIVPGRYWIANAIRACSKYNALVGPAGRIYNEYGYRNYYKLVIPGVEKPHTISCNDTDVYCDWVCNSYLFKREWVGHALNSMRYKDSFKTFDDIQLATSLYISAGIRCVTPMQPSFDKELHGSLQHHYGNDSNAIWKTNSDQHFAGRKAYIEYLIEGGYVPVQNRENLYRFHLIVPFGERNTLERCLLTIKGQDYQNFTCTLIDDCCDGKDALEIVRRIGLDKSSTRYIKMTKKAYPLRAREIATDMLEANLADVVVHVDGDDWLPYPDVLTRLNRVYRTGNYHVSYGNAVDVTNWKSDNFKSYRPRVMSRRWNVMQDDLDAEVYNYRKITKKEVAKGWRYAPWTNMHMRSYLYAKWIGLDRNNFKLSNGNYLRKATDAAILLPILDSTLYENVAWIPELSYIYLNGNNTIHSKNEVSPNERRESLSIVAKHQNRLCVNDLKNFLTNSELAKRNQIFDDGLVLHDTLIKDKKISNKNFFKSISFARSNLISVCTIVTPNYLADALLCSLSYRRNINKKIDVYIFISTCDHSKIKILKEIFYESNIHILFPDTLKHTKLMSDQLIEKYGVLSDQYRWGMKGVVLMELLSLGYDSSLFLDPDTYTTSDVSDIQNLIESHDISLFPHFRNPDLEHSRKILYTDGFFNGGVLAANINGFNQLLKLFERCLGEMTKDSLRNRWDDQKYLDLIPLESKGVLINNDRGINYNPWNYDALEGVVGPSQRSILLKSGFFLRNLHITTSFINNVIDAKQKRFQVFRFVVSTYLLTNLYINYLIFFKYSCLKDNAGDCLEIGLRIDFFKGALNKIIPQNKLVELLGALDGVMDKKMSTEQEFFKEFLNSVKNSICFDNNKLLADILACIFPNCKAAHCCADDLKQLDLRYLADKNFDVAELNFDDKSQGNRFNEVDIVKLRLENLQSFNITY